MSDFSSQTHPGERRETAPPPPPPPPCWTPAGHRAPLEASAMASPEPCAAAAAAAAAPGSGFGAVDGVLPPELLLEVLLRLPAKPICRLRAVCRSWLSFTTDRLFLAAYAAVHPHPLLAVLVDSFPSRCCVDLVDLSGNVVEEILGVGGECRVLTASYDRVLVAGEHHRVSVLDPATGSVSALPFGIAEDMARRNGMRPAWFAFGQTNSTGEYKLLRILEDLEDGYEADPVCEVFAIGDMNGRWRKMESPPGYLDPSCTNGVVSEGAAYFFLDHWQMDPSYYFATGCIPSFDLATEQWSTALQGPVNRILEEANGTLNYADLTDRLMLAQLEGTLCTAHFNDRISAVDLWFLVDFENGMWSKEYRINVEFAFDGFGDGVQPLLVTDEGNVVLWVQIGSKGMVWIYNPVTNTSSEIVQTKASIFTGVGKWKKCQKKRSKTDVRTGVIAYWRI
uniref:F-box domain-containing protein n=1 Tax=Oryza rufipogon TaxID=4529 RepID=A0A0E0Q628_ORYRU